MIKKSQLQKNLDLSMEFDTYVMKHDALLRKIPNRVNIIFVVDSDKKLSEANRDIARGRRGRFVEAHKSGNKWDIRPIIKK